MKNTKDLLINEPQAQLTASPTGNEQIFHWKRKYFSVFWMFFLKVIFIKTSGVIHHQYDLNRNTHSSCLGLGSLQPLTQTG